MDDETFQPTAFITGNQALTASSFPFNHSNLAIRSNTASNLQSAASQLQSQSNDQPVQNTAFNPATVNSSILHTAFNPHDVETSIFNADLSFFERMSAAVTFIRMGQGRQTGEDIEYYHKFNHYPARSLDGVEFNVQFKVNPTVGRAETCFDNTMNVPAARCDTVGKLFKASKDHWRSVYSELGMAFPKDGIWAEDVAIHVVDTHGCAKHVWTKAYDAARYQKFFRDQVIHGRTDTLLVRLTHTQPAEE